LDALGLISASVIALQETRLTEVAQRDLEADLTDMGFQVV